MTDEIKLDEVIDSSGAIRRCGLLPEPAGFKSSLALADDSIKLYTEEQMKDALADPDRTPARSLFDSSWILNQLSYGSCVGHGAAGCGMRTRYRSGLGKLLLSGSWIYSFINGGRDNGAMVDDGLLAAMEHGFAPLALVPATQIYRHQQPANAAQEAAKIKCLSGFRTKDLNVFRCGLTAGMTGAVALQAGSRYTKIDGDGVCGVDAGMGNHCVGVQDIRWSYKFNRWEYDHFGSWGTNVFDGGYGWLVDAHFRDPIRYATFYLFARTIETVQRDLAA